MHGVPVGAGEAWSGVGTLVVAHGGVHHLVPMSRTPNAGGHKGPHSTQHRPRPYGKNAHLPKAYPELLPYHPS